MIIKDIRPSNFMHPMIIFTSTWCLVYLLYTMKLSHLLLYDSSIALNTVLLIMLPFFMVSITFIVISKLNPADLACCSNIIEVRSNIIEAKLYKYMLIWVLITLVEVVYSNGLPIVWLISGSEKTYFDFGIPSIHGFMNSYLLGSSLISFLLYLIDYNKRHLVIPFFTICWGVVAISRHLIITNVIQILFLFLLFKSSEIKIVSVIRYLITILIVVYLFGVIGDLRSGAGMIRQVGLPTESYPDWLPSGVLWGYLYITTPMNNLINTMSVYVPEMDFSFPYTFSQLIPSAIRNLIYDETLLTKGELVSDAFTVSTAFVDSFKDAGRIGLIMFSAMMGMVANYIWLNRKSLLFIICYAVVAQCLFLSLFYNHLMHLPVVFQILWIKLFINDNTVKLGDDCRL